MSAFKELYLRQLRAQFELYERINKPTKTRLDRDRVILKNLDDSVEEIIEARRHVHCRKEWNPTKQFLPMNEIDLADCREEIIDAFHFLMTALIYSDASWEDVELQLREKMLFNDHREDHKYGE